jgi:hypothetical protein
MSLSIDYSKLFKDARVDAVEEHSLLDVKAHVRLYGDRHLTTESH